MTFHMLDVVRAGTVVAAAINVLGVVVSIDERWTLGVYFNGALLVLAIVYFAQVTRVRRRELA